MHDDAQFGRETLERGLGGKLDPRLNGFRPIQERRDPPSFESELEMLVDDLFSDDVHPPESRRIENRVVRGFRRVSKARAREDCEDGKG